MAEEKTKFEEWLDALPKPATVVITVAKVEAFLRAKGFVRKEETGAPSGLRRLWGGAEAPPKVWWEAEGLRLNPPYRDVEVRWISHLATDGMSVVFQGSRSCSFSVIRDDWGKETKESRETLRRLTEELYRDVVQPAPVLTPERVVRIPPEAVGLRWEGGCDDGSGAWVSPPRFLSTARAILARAVEALTE